MIRTTFAVLIAALATGCASTSTVQHGSKVQFSSAKAPTDFLACVKSNAEEMNGVMLMLSFKPSTAEDGSPRLVIDRPMNNFAVIDAKPAGTGTAATLHLGFAAFSPSYSRDLVKGCA
jgi:hypothetical protein